MHFKTSILTLIGLACLGAIYIWYRGNALQTSHPAQKIVISREALKDISNIVPVAVIGSGPAGLSAALYSSRMNWPTVVFEGALPGGQLTGTSDIENWPGVGIVPGPRLMKDIKEHVSSFGVRFIPQTIKQVDFSTWPYKLWTSDGQEVRALSVVVATGAYPSTLGAVGEQEYWGKGVSTCAVCDAPFYKGKVVGVVGGGDSAAEEALELASFARSVIMLVRGERMRASAIMQERIKNNSHITVRYNTKVKQVVGDGTHVTGVEITNSEKQTELLVVDGLFLGIGHKPNTELFKGQLLRNEAGYITLSGRDQATSKPCIFAAGDVVDFVYRQAGVAAGDGIRAALDADRCLEASGIDDTFVASLVSRYFNPVQPTVSVSLPTLTTSKELDSHLLNEKRLLVLDFYATYCPSCMQMLPVFEETAAQLADKAVFLKTDVGVASELAERFAVSMIPTFLIFKAGEVVGRSTEIMNKQQMIEFVEQYS